MQRSSKPAGRRLTKAGRRLLRSAVPIWERTHEQIERLLAGTGGRSPGGRIASVVGRATERAALVDEQGTPRDR